MSRLLCVVFAWSLLALGMAVAHPARPLYEPTPIPKPPAPKLAPNMAGSTWLGKYNQVNRLYTFEFDGTVSYATSAKGKSFKNRGKWRIEGSTFIFDHNIGTATLLEFRGVFVDPNTIVGEQNMVKTGVKSKVTMKRETP
jgi:hypothetical protein